METVRASRPDDATVTWKPPTTSRAMVTTCLDVGVVLDVQDRAQLTHDRRRPPSRSQPGVAAGSVEEERRSRALVGREADGPAHALDELLRDGQAEARAASRRRRRRRPARTSRRSGRWKASRDPRPWSDTATRTLILAGFDVDPDLRPPCGLGELRGVRQQVREHLDAAGAGRHRPASVAVAAPCTAMSNAVVVGVRLVVLDGPLDDGHDWQMRLARIGSRRRPGFSMSSRSLMSGSAAGCSSARCDHALARSGSGPATPAGDEAEGAADRGQRCAQLVADRRDELASSSGRRACAR